MNTFLETEVYPKLSHEIIFKNLDGLKSTGKGITADCPSCGSKGTLYAMHGKRYAACNRRNNCAFVVSWFDWVTESKGFMGNKKAVLFALAELANIEVPNSNASPKVFSDIYQVREFIANYGKKGLFENTPEGEQFRAYLLNRGFTLEMLQGDEFMALNRDRLIKHLYQSGIPDKLIKLSGILTKGYGEDYQLLFPYRGIDGKIEGFIGRLNPQLVPSNGIRPKYKNSFGISRSAPFQMHKVSHEILTIVEGPIDAKIMRHNGINAVALSGDYPSDAEMKVLTESSSNIILLSMDSDTAGCNATMRLLPALMAAGKRVFVMNNFNGLKDPGEFIQAHGFHSYKKLQDNAAISAASWVVHQKLLSIQKEEVFGQIQKVAELSDIYHLTPNEDKGRFVSDLTENTFLNEKDIAAALNLNPVHTCGQKKEAMNGSA